MHDDTATSGILCAHLSGGATSRNFHQALETRSNDPLSPIGKFSACFPLVCRPSFKVWLKENFQLFGSWSAFDHAPFAESEDHFYPYEELVDLLVIVFVRPGMQ